MDNAQHNVKQICTVAAVYLWEWYILRFLFYFNSLSHHDQPTTDYLKSFKVVVGLNQ